MRLGTWDWRRWGQQQALTNAREATVELSRARVERNEIELYLAEHRRWWEESLAAEAAGHAASAPAWRRRS